MFEMNLFNSLAIISFITIVNTILFYLSENAANNSEYKKSSKRIKLLKTIRKYYVFVYLILAFLPMFMRQFLNIVFVKWTYLFCVGINTICMLIILFLSTIQTRRKPSRKEFHW
jgi:hypothetical protein